MKNNKSLQADPGGYRLFESPWFSKKLGFYNLPGCMPRAAELPVSPLYIIVRYFACAYRSDSAITEKSRYGRN
jgi:hypothetical protein